MYFAFRQKSFQILEEVFELILLSSSKIIFHQFFSVIMG